MDLSSIKPSSRPVPIKHPVTDEPTGLVFRLLPDSDPKVKAVRRKRMDAHLNRRNKFTAVQLEAFSLDLLVAATEGWEWNGDIDFRGSKPEFNEANVRAVLKELEWARKQLDEELGDDAAFFQS
jgi:hypothetical protein